LNLAVRSILESDNGYLYNYLLATVQLWNQYLFT